MGADSKISDQFPIIFFDGVCNLCNSSVNFVIDHDSKALFRFASLQSDFAKVQLQKFELDSNHLGSIVLLLDGRVFTKSSAALHIAKRLDGIWSFLYFFRVVPKPIRNMVYDWIAANRYIWFGKSDACRMPAPELKQRFLDS